MNPLAGARLSFFQVALLKLAPSMWANLGSDPNKASSQRRMNGALFKEAAGGCSALGPSSTSLNPSASFLSFGRAAPLTRRGRWMPRLLVGDPTVWVMPRDSKQSSRAAGAFLSSEAARD